MTIKHRITPRPLRLATGLAVALAAVAVQAQPVYRIVGPDGRVTYSDQPPTASGKAAVSTETAAPGGGASGASLPFDLRQVANRYPVTLYTGSNCEPCSTGRAMLSSRGVPFTERTVNTNEDIAALQRLSGDNTLPFLTIGGQQLKGYSDLEWKQYLDAAGYPKSSQLPSGYRNPPAAPLVALKLPPAPAAAGAGNGNAAAGSPAPAAPAAPAPSNPAGIRF
jgi:glutaredoxin